MKQWETPYNVVYKKYNRSQIWFEGSALFVNLSIELAHQITGALNGAYNMGRYHEQLKNKE